MEYLCTILGSKYALRSSDYVNHPYDYRPNNMHEKNYSVLIGKDKCSFLIIQCGGGLVQCKGSDKPDILIDHR